MRVLMTQLLASVLALLLIWQPAVAGITYYHNDALGSPVAATDENGKLLWREAYAPFGEKLNNSPAQGDSRIAYTGKLHDDDTGLTYMNARYYDPVVGRFMAIDPVGPLQGGLEHVNRYDYAYNNPYRYIDPTGMQGESPAEKEEEMEERGALHEEPISITGFAPGLKIGHQHQSGINPGMALQVGLMGAARSAAAPKAAPAPKAVPAPKALNTPSIKEQALDLKVLNNYKNTVTVQSDKMLTHFDLDGATHKGVETPHTQYSYEHKNPKGETFFNKDRKTVEPMTQQDIRTVRNILERRNQQ